MEEQEENGDMVSFHLRFLGRFWGVGFKMEKSFNYIVVYIKS